MRRVTVPEDACGCVDAPGLPGAAPYRALLARCRWRRFDAVGAPGRYWRSASQPELSVPDVWVLAMGGTRRDHERHGDTAGRAALRPSADRRRPRADAR